MAKKKAQKPQRLVTQRQLSRWQREKRRQRVILGVGIFIIAAVLVIMGVGWYTNQYQPMRQTVIRVNDTEFNMRYYVETLKLIGRNQSVPSLQFVADNVIKDIEQNELIKQGALKKLGISISDDAVNKELKSSDLPDNASHRDLVRTRLLIGKLQGEYFEQEVPVSAEQRHIMAMLLESEPSATAVSARLENGESFTELAEELSLDYLAKTNQGDFGWHPESIFNEMLASSIPVEYAFGAEAGVVSQPLYDEEISKGVGYWLLKVVNRNEEEEAIVQAMLLSSEEEVLTVRNRLEAGEDFATLARELSQLPGVESNGGDLGPVVSGDWSPAFDEFVFNPEVEPGTLSQPLRDETVTTKGAYWLVKVVDKDDNRQIEDNDRDWLKAKALNEWVSSLWDDPENEVDDSYLDSEKKAWAIKQAARG